MITLPPFLPDLLFSSLTHFLFSLFLNFHLLTGLHQSSENGISFKGTWHSDDKCTDMELSFMHQEGKQQPSACEVSLVPERKVLVKRLMSEWSTWNNCHHSLTRLLLLLFFFSRKSIFYDLMCCHPSVLNVTGLKVAFTHPRSILIWEKKNLNKTALSHFKVALLKQNCNCF